MGNLRDELKKIREKHGYLTARVVYEEAKDPEHPLHHRVFDVPADQAAERYYLANAAKLLRVRHRVDLPDGPADLRSFWAVRPSAEAATDYVPVEIGIQDPLLRRLQLQRMLRAWKSLKQDYGHLVEFSQMVQADPSIFMQDGELTEPYDEAHEDLVDGKSNGTEG